MKNKIEIVLDTETAQNSQVLDLGIVVLKNRRIISKKNFLVHGVYGVVPPFSTLNNSSFSENRISEKLEYYENLLKSGSAIIASPAYIQAYFNMLISKYSSITLWAYNVGFDINALALTNINLDAYKHKCIWQLALSTVCYNRDYKKFCLSDPNKYLTAKHNFSTSCETVLDFISNHTNAIPENVSHPHYAMADALGEYYILKYLARLKLRKPISGYNWQDHRIQDHVKII